VISRRRDGIVVANRGTINHPEVPRQKEEKVIHGIKTNNLGQTKGDRKNYIFRSEKREREFISAKMDSQEKLAHTRSISRFSSTYTGGKHDEYEKIVIFSHSFTRMAASEPASIPSQ
jgi:hypothetical protein